MKTDNTIFKELEEVAPSLINISRQNLYTVPAGYFDEIAGDVVRSIRLQTVSAYETFSVPEGYFDGLALQILHKVAGAKPATTEVEAELQEIAPVLNSISKQPVYTVPAGYFESLQPQVNSAQNLPAKVVSPSRFSRFTKYAAAAVITGIIATGGVLFFNNNEPVQPPSVAKVQEFKPADVESLSEEEIADFLATQGSPSDMITASSISVDQNLDKTMQEIPDEELQQYLKDNPEPGS